MEQTYKIPTDQIGQLENLPKVVDSVFLSECLKHFNAMFLSWKEAVERHQGS